MKRRRYDPRDNVPEWSRTLYALMDEAVAEYCDAHGLTVSRGTPDSCRLFSHEQPPRTDTIGREWPGFHPRCERVPRLFKSHIFLLGGKPAVIVSQPEPSFDIRPTLLWSYDRPISLRVNEWPAWYFPGKVKMLEVWAGWAWEIARFRRDAAAKPTAVARWVEEWAERTAKARGEK